VERVSRIKGAGYLVSSVSVILLAIPGLTAAMENPWFGVCLAIGVAASIGGMLLRWRSHRLEQREK
jgi:drug/metabolite transporter (DMT)-like permease